MNETLQKKHIITIAGRPGSGKSTTAKTVAAQLGFRHYSTGDMFRQLGQERGIDVLQTNLTAEQNAELDHMVDEKTQEIGKHAEELVIDSRMAWHWIPGSFKVFLDLDLAVAAERILKNMDETRLISENIPRDPVEYAVTLQQRLSSEVRRYKSLYGVNPFDISNYDLVIDTAENNLEATVARVVADFQSWIQS